MPKISLIPVEAKLKKIRAELKTASLTANPKKQKVLKRQITGLGKAIDALVKTCNEHDVG